MVGGAVQYVKTLVYISVVEVVWPPCERLRLWRHLLALNDDVFEWFGNGGLWEDFAHYLILERLCDCIVF